MESSAILAKKKAVFSVFFSSLPSSWSERGWKRWGGDESPFHPSKNEKERSIEREKRRQCGKRPLCKGYIKI